MQKIGIIKNKPSLATQNSLVSIGFECLDRDMFQAEKCYDPLGQTGVKNARVQTGWVKCEKEKGVYDFSWLDDVVNNLLSRGIQPWFNLGYGNPLYMDDISTPSAVGCVPIAYGEEVMAAWGNYIRALAEHYKGMITHFEVWNEPNLKSFWYPKNANPKDYAALVTFTGDIIRNIIPDCKIGGCISARKWEYLETFFSSLVPGKIDFFCLHLYMIMPEENYRESIDNLRRIMKKHGHDSCEAWQGEAGFPSWFPEKHFYPHTKQSSEHQQAVWMLRRFFLDASAGLGMSSFFQIADMWERPYDKATRTEKKPAAHGILNGITYTSKKSYTIIGRVANLFSGGVKPLDCYMAGDYAGSLEKTYSRILIPLMRGNTPLFCYYVPYFVQDETVVKNGFWLDIAKSPEWGEIDEYAIVDMYTGEVFSVEPSSETDVMLHFTDLPFCDYPMVICPKSAIDAEIEEKI